MSDAARRVRLAGDRLLTRRLGIALTFALLLTAPTLEAIEDAGSDAGDASVAVVVDASAPPIAQKAEPKQAKPDMLEAARPMGPELPPDLKPLPPASIALGERKLCTIHLSRAGLSPEERAHRASHVLEQALEDGRPHEIRVSFEGSTAIIRVGDAPLVQLGAEDAAAAGDASVSVNAESCAASVREGLRTELRRRAIANVVFSASLIVLSGLLAFLMLGVVSRTAQRVSALLEARETLPALKIGTLELITPAAIRVAASTAIGIAKPVVQIVIVFSWATTSMSLFPVTQALARRTTGYVLVPLSTFLGRVGAALPLLVLVLLGAFTLAMLLRFLRVFFDNVAQGGIHLTWLSPRQAVPASIVARTIAIVGALLAAAPLLSGDSAEWGALRIAGVALTAALVLALTPMFANAALGVLALYSDRFEPESLVEIGSHSGKLLAITLTHLHIADRTGADIRVPHLFTLWQPLRVLGDALPSSYEIVVDAKAPQGPIRKALVDAVRRQGRAAHVELTEIEGERAVYLVMAMAAPGEEDLASAIADELTRQSVTFTRIRKLAA